MTDPGFSRKEPPDQTKLTRGLKSRHIELIAIGGAIGVGLFLGSAKVIQKAGPGLILGYAIGGLVIVFIMRALGELLLYRPVAGSFVMYADEFVGPFAGFATGWSYWFMWVVTGMAELTAIGVYVSYWLPDLPQWIWVLAALVVLYGANMLAVRVFGEMEFWFALIKVAMIVMLIVGGLAVILFGVGDLGATAGFSNLWSHGGFLPFGFVGVLLTFQMVMFGFQGVELIGVTAGEAENPQVVLPRATNSIIYRILIFYIGALLVIMSLVPWNELEPRTSPFVLVFDRIGLPRGADIVNLVVITAAMSSCNSGLYSTGRMLHALAQIGRAPSALGAINRRRLPATGINASAALMLIGVLLNFLVPERVFIWVTSVALIGTLWTWAIIMLAHRGYRKAVHAGRARGVSYRMPGAPLANWLVVGFLIAVAALLSLDPETRVALYVAPIWFALLGLAYVRMRPRPRQNAQFAVGQRPLP
jgi:AAT family amino acid transporter/D-serine/D-alanine/glycine transporter